MAYGGSVKLLLRMFRAGILGSCVGVLVGISIAIAVWFGR